MDRGRSGRPQSDENGLAVFEVDESIDFTYNKYMVFSGTIDPIRPRCCRIGLLPCRRRPPVGCRRLSCRAVVSKGVEALSTRR